MKCKEAQLILHGKRRAATFWQIYSIYEMDVADKVINKCFVVVQSTKTFTLPDDVELGIFFWACSTLGAEHLWRKQQDRKGTELEVLSNGSVTNG